jgi:hypothetical protein
MRHAVADGVDVHERVEGYPSAQTLRPPLERAER